MHLVVAERGSKAPGSKYLPRIFASMSWVSDADTENWLPGAFSGIFFCAICSIIFRFLQYLIIYTAESLVMCNAICNEAMGKKPKLTRNMYDHIIRAQKFVGDMCEGEAGVPPPPPEEDEEVKPSAKEVAAQEVGEIKTGKEWPVAPPEDAGAEEAVAQGGVTEGEAPGAAVVPAATE